MSSEFSPVVVIKTFEMTFPSESQMTAIHAIEQSAHDVVATVTVKATANVAELNRLFVSRQYRRMGIGRKLVEFVANAAREKNCDCVSASVHPHNTEALFFYRELGFFEATRFDDSHVLMVLKL